jgi:hypothetical protein
LILQSNFPLLLVLSPQRMFVTSLIT